MPSPVKALLLLFPISPSDESKKKEEDEKLEAGKTTAVDPTIIWIKQTVG